MGRYCFYSHLVLENGGIKRERNLPEVMDSKLWSWDLNPHELVTESEFLATLLCSLETLSQTLCKSVRCLSLAPICSHGDIIY